VRAIRTAYQITQFRLNVISAPSARALTDRAWLTIADHWNATTCCTLSDGFVRKRAISTLFQTGQCEAKLTVEEAALAPRVDAPLLHIGLELERDDEQAAIDVRVRSRRRVVRRVDVHDPRANLDSAVGTRLATRLDLRERKRKRLPEHGDEERAPGFAVALNRQLVKHICR
jgi:hypothetical protein